MSENTHTVLVTRPQHQAGEFVKLLKNNGFNSLEFASIEILPVELSEILKQKLSSLNEYDLILFISANAVQQALNLLRQLNLTSADFTVPIATIGKATLDAATSAGFKVSICPQQGFNSSALLALEALQAEQIKGARCLIMRGVGGLEKLADELHRRGAQVEYAQVYQRKMPREDGEISRKQLSKNWDSFGISAITTTSNESLQNLYDMLEPPGQTRMLNTLLVVASERTENLARTLGFKFIKCAKSAINSHMLDALETQFNE